jgi:hypothetical protein
MGFTPAQVWAMSLWEFSAAFDGWRRANTADAGPEFPTREEHIANVERVTLH